MLELWKKATKEKLPFVYGQEKDYKGEVIENTGYTYRIKGKLVRLYSEWFSYLIYTQKEVKVDLKRMESANHPYQLSLPGDFCIHTHTNGYIPNGTERDEESGPEHEQDFPIGGNETAPPSSNDWGNVESKSSLLHLNKLSSKKRNLYRRQFFDIILTPDYIWLYRYKYDSDDLYSPNNNKGKREQKILIPIAY